MHRPKYKKRWHFITVYTGKYLVITALMLFLLSTLIAQRKTYGSDAPKPFMYGIYNVENMSFKGKTLAPLTTDSTRWKQMIISYDGYAQVKTMNDSTFNFTTVFNAKKKELVLNSQDKEAAQYILTYNVIGKDKLLISGLKGKDSISVSFKRKGPKDFRLINRGFHWINEYPYNR
jgi:hypothetical protein